MALELALVLLVALLWTAPGLLVGLWMTRRGHDARWMAIAAVLGPLFVPIALERVEHRPRLAVSSTVGREVPESVGPGLRVLVGLDGSEESRAALAAALELVEGRCGLLMLAEVVDYDAQHGDAYGHVRRATARLVDAVAQARDAGVEAGFEVLAGPPGETLRRFAEDQEMDLLVVGRRGRGLSRRLLGRVSADLVHHASVPVLVAGSAGRVAASAPETAVRTTVHAVGG